MAQNYASVVIEPPDNPPPLPTPVEPAAAAEYRKYGSPSMKRMAPDPTDLTIIDVNDVVSHSW